MAATVSTHPFEEQFLLTELEDTPACQYLIRYLKELKASAILFEPHYVDRHFIDDYAHYYARAFAPPDPWCCRLHFFAETSAAELDALLDDFYEGGSDRRSEVQARLQAGYLGYVVVRPLSDARLGRTVLKPWDSEKRRRYEAVREYRAHVAGVELRVQGLAFQQQDRGVAACASIALWSALQQVAKLDGHRTPTPSAVTMAARSPYPPTYGLTGDQMANALATLGYVAESFGPENPALFRAKLASCLRSHLPVILWVGSDDGAGGHAVTVTGFSEPATVVRIDLDAKTGFKMRDGSVDVIYVHDDNLGSHAHYELISRKNDKGEPWVYLQRGNRKRPQVDWWNIDELPIIAAVVPKPPKLRLPIENLILDIVELGQEIDKMVGADKVDFTARFAAGVRYREELLAVQPMLSGSRTFHQSLSLPRFVGVVSVNLNGRHLFDAILDVTELSRKPRQPSVLALAAHGVPTRSRLHKKLQALADFFECPAAFGPIAP